MVLNFTCMHISALNTPSFCSPCTPQDFSVCSEMNAEDTVCDQVTQCPLYAVPDKLKSFDSKLELDKSSRQQTALSVCMVGGDC